MKQDLLEMLNKYYELISKLYEDIRDLIIINVESSKISEYNML